MPIKSPDYLFVGSTASGNENDMKAGKTDYWNSQ